MYSTTKICAHVFTVLSTHESNGRSACIWSCSGTPRMKMSRLARRLPWLLNCNQRFPKGSRGELVLEGALPLFLPGHTLFDTTGSRVLTITGFVVQNNDDWRPLFIVYLFSCVSVACFVCCLIVWLMLNFFFVYFPKSSYNNAILKMTKGISELHQNCFPFIHRTLFCSLHKSSYYPFKGLKMGISYTTCGHSWWCKKELAFYNTAG
jgi:hypothetical protein